jgi:hypothetical protein
MKKETGSPCSNPFEVSDEKKRPIKAWAVVLDGKVEEIMLDKKNYKDIPRLKLKIVPCEIKLKEYEK